MEVFYSSKIYPKAFFKSISMISIMIDSSVIIVSCKDLLLAKSSHCLVNQPPPPPPVNDSTVITLFWKGLFLVKRLPHFMASLFVCENHTLAQEDLQ